MNKKNLINISFFTLLILITIYKFKFFQLQYYYHQFDFIEVLSTILINYTNITNKIGLNEVIIYFIRSSLIFGLNLISLFLYLKINNLKKIDIYLAIIFFSLMPNVYLRMFYGHISLMMYWQIFLSFYLFHTSYKNYIKFVLLIALVIISFYYHQQIFIYHLIILHLYIIYYYQHKEKFNLKLFLIYIFFILVAYFFFKDLIFELNFISEKIHTYDTVKKYSLNNPLGLIYFDHDFYLRIINIFNNEKINNLIQNYDIFLKNYSFNGPESTFFYGFSSLLIILTNLLNKKTRWLGLFSFFLILIIILIIMNPIFHFSLIKIHYNFFPFIRSVSRFLYIIDFVVIINFIHFLKNQFGSKAKFLILLLYFFESMSFKFNSVPFDHEKFFIDTNSFKNIKIIDYQSSYLEYRYILRYLENKNGLQKCISDCNTFIEIKDDGEINYLLKN